MKKHYFLGLAAGYSRKERLRHTFAVGFERDRSDLAKFLSDRYGGKAILCKNGRSALALALKAYFDPGDAVIVNGFTCYAVYEAVKVAGLTPVFADISKDDLNIELTPSEESDASRSNFARARRYGARSLKLPVGRNDLEASDSFARVRGIIIQNTLGNPVDIETIEEFAKEHNLTIIEDLAHSTGVKYPDGREVGTVGVATALSFGKDKSIDTVSGGAVVLRYPCKHTIKAPSKTPKASDHLRERFYPLFGAMCRGLSYVKLNGVLMRLLLKLRWVEKSADNRLDLTRKISKFEAKLALRQFKNLKKSGEPLLREFYFVRDRGEVLAKLAKAGYYFGGFWYEKPVSPERYYKRVHFDEEQCPNAVWVSEHIVNLPNYYSKQELAEARKIIKEYQEEVK